MATVGVKRLIQFCDYVMWVFVRQNTTGRSWPMYDRLIDRFSCLLLVLRVKSRREADGVCDASSE